MVQVERLDSATEIVTDPRFGPPQPSELDMMHRQSEWNFFFLVFAMGLIFNLFLTRSRR
ncbi:hypothetical protein TPY_2151 [Sulfobacillus acidophilus TPY]|uniref:Uncharacterized protein n=1 Tax=Sulfobacillus acidophilus (strain ATCC 700253 / DSM 10332 / NAL) TaxID=679936 RepID=G8TZB6_SULAD|nr:hypothetical protein TPY_2151 [Sulfobacillus acidophilus TPY]AEW04085.1 hypothetical protein Sulac_0545 [Sulfobacillus acidophilus DSM 10332]